MVKMNKKAFTESSLFFSILVAIVIFFAGMLVVSLLKPVITQSRLDSSCIAPLSDGGKALCLLFDITIPYFFVLIISIIGGIAVEKFLT